MGLDLDFLTVERSNRLHLGKPKPSIEIISPRKAHIFLHYLIDKNNLKVSEEYNNLGNILSFLISLEVDRDRFRNEIEVVETQLNHTYLSVECNERETPLMETMDEVIEGIRHYINMNPMIIDQDIFIYYNYGDLHRL